MGCMKIADFIRSKLDKNKYARPILSGISMIALITLISVISVHYLLGNTLADYARANPDTAYGKDDAAGNTSADTTGDAAGNTSSDAAADAASETPDGTSPEASSETPAYTPGNALGDAPDIPEYNRSVMVRFYDPENDSSSRQTYKPGFYHEPLSQSVKDYITGTSYPADGDPVISYEDLSYAGILYIDYNGLTQAGELLCNKNIAQDLVEIFYELYSSDYRIGSVYLIDNYGGDSTASMCADNTSCFNYIPDKDSSSLSRHAYGLAIDVNPFYNPYVEFGTGEDGSDLVTPPGSEIYADRSASFPYKIDEYDLCYRLFTSHGFKWGGDMNSCKDYSHFQKNP